MYKNKLKEVRLANNVLQKQIANILNISEISYTHYESEYYIMPTKYLNDVCNYFNVSFDYLFEFTESNNYKNSVNNIDTKLCGKRLKELRKTNSFTQQDMGKILNCSYGTLAGYESGRYLIATPFLYDICKKYKISADYLLGKTDEPKYLK